MGGSTGAALTLRLARPGGARQWQARCGWNTGAMWNPDVYLAFADHRGRPFFDLLSRVGAETPRRVVDLGCGPGNLTVTLRSAGPTRSVEAVDSSPEMVEAARERGLDAGRRHRRAGHRARHRRRRDQRRAAVGARTRRAAGPLGGRSWPPGRGSRCRCRATSTPRRTRRCAPWPAVSRSQTRCATCRSERPKWSSTPGGYADLLTDAGCAVDAWETTYVHELTGETSGAGVDHRHRAGPVIDRLSERRGSSTASSSSRCSPRHIRGGPTAGRSSRSGGYSLSLRWV